MAKLIENEVKGIQLKEGQKVLDVEGNEYLIEKGDILREYIEEDPNVGDFVIIQKVADSTGVIDTNEVGDEIQGTVDAVDKTTFGGLRLKLNIDMPGKPNYGVFYVPKNYRIIYINGERYDG